MENIMTEKEVLNGVLEEFNVSVKEENLLQSSKTGELYKALCEASLKFGKIEKDKVNPHFKSAYASLDSILPAVKPALLEKYLFLHSYFQPLEDSQGLFVVRLFHAESEQWISSVLKLSLPSNLTPQLLQSLGSVITYLRRYSTGMLLNLNTDEDDDGNGADLSKGFASSKPAYVPKTKPTTPSFQPPANGQPANTSDQARVTAFSKLKKIREELGIEPEENKNIVNNLGYTAMKDIPMDKMDVLEQMYRDYVASRDI